MVPSFATSLDASTGLREKQQRGGRGVKPSVLDGGIDLDDRRRLVEVLGLGGIEDAGAEALGVRGAAGESATQTLADVPFLEVAGDEPGEEAVAGADAADDRLEQRDRRLIHAVVAAVLDAREAAVGLRDDRALGTHLADDLERVDDVLPCLL